MFGDARCKPRRTRAAARMVLAGCIVFAGLATARAQKQSEVFFLPQLQEGPGNLQTNPAGIIATPFPGTAIPLTEKQKKALLKQNFRNTQRDVLKLSKLVQSLQRQMKKSSPNVLSVNVVKQTERIEKLAKKIKNEAKEY